MWTSYKNAKSSTVFVFEFAAMLKEAVKKIKIVEVDFKIRVYKN